MPLVKIKPGLSHGYYDTVTKTHAYYQAGDVFDASPAEMESFGDKFEMAGEDLEQDVRKILTAAAEEYTESDAVSWTEVVATPAARRLAQEHSVSPSLSNITGTGKDGKITKVDVEALLDGDAQR